MDFREIKILQASLQEGRVIYKEKDIRLLSKFMKVIFYVRRQCSNIDYVEKTR